MKLYFCVSLKLIQKDERKICSLFYKFKKRCFFIKSEMNQTNTFLLSIALGGILVK